MAENAESESSWLNFHLYYHQDLDVACLRFALPLIAELLRSGWVDRFFFIRYRLGGPHLRLRLHPRSGTAALVTGAAEARARDFLASRPSTSQLPVEVILRNTREILASDPHERDAAIYPDNAFLAFPFRPEIERYGGPELWEDSVDFFTLSSATVLELLAAHGNEPRSRRLALAFRLLACQALSFARDAEDLRSLLRYAVEAWGAGMPKAVAKAERVLVEQRRALDRLLERELYLFATGPSAVASAVEEAKARLGEAACRLSWALRTADCGVHQRIATSQLHMTANRLGLNNAEEVYLSEILTRMAAELQASGETLGIVPVGNRAPQGGGTGSLRLRDLLPEALARIAAGGFPSSML